VKVPTPLRIAALIVATTSFYMYVGQMVPQKEVYPPKEIVLQADLGPAEMAKAGREIMENKGLCFTCHTIGKKEGPYRFPDLDGVDVRAKTRKPGYSDVDYLAESIYEPSIYIVPGFNPGMPVINKPPIGLTDQEILCVIAYLQTLGGTTTVTMHTTLKYQAGHEAAAAAAAPAVVAQRRSRSSSPSSRAWSRSVC
jgi:mono/diheme cytochrome c family protein